MKLNPIGKPIRIRINVGGKEHSILKTLMDTIKSQDFVLDELCHLWQNGSLSRWLEQIGEKNLKSKLPKPTNTPPTQCEITALLACFGISDIQAVNRKMIEKYKEENNATALVKTLDNMARYGDNDAAVELSEYYCTGKYGITCSDALRLKYALMAAERGHLEANCYVADCYRDGKGTDQSASEAIKWYEKALEEGSMRAGYELGMIYYSGIEDQLEKSYLQALQYFQNTAKSNYKDSNWYVAKCLYHLGEHAKALHFFDRLVMQSGNPEKGWYSVGVWIIEHYPNDERGYKYIKESAEKGCPEAQTYLGVCYLKGKHGIDKNEYIGLPWLIQAALQGHQESFRQLLSFSKDIYSYPYSFRNDLAKVFKQAADNGIEEAKIFIENNKYSSLL